MCEVCEREAAQKIEAEKAARAAEPKRELLVSEVLRGEPCYEYSQKLDRFELGTIEVSVSLAVEQADDWDWYWAASRLLTEAGYEKFSEEAAKASQEQSAQIQPYREAAQEQERAAQREYNRIKDQVLDATGDWNKAYDEANKVYVPMVAVGNAVMKAAREITQARVNKAHAKLFAELYISEDGTEEKTGNQRWYAADSDYDEYDDEDEDY